MTIEQGLIDTLLLGAYDRSKYNMAMMTKQKLDFKIVAGVNVPMLLSVLTGMPATADEAVQIALNQDNWGIELEEMPQARRRRLLK